MKEILEIIAMFAIVILGTCGLICLALWASLFTVEYAMRVFKCHRMCCRFIFHYEQFKACHEKNLKHIYGDKGN